eukprot:TRINITY_DN180_c1_g1_i4.p1 TRINITY_DN180_c1_g1~~TRINITY_DN180_c1_g1_i4.p1  ORF type:complete len:290 (-),score=42.09 TRINITY_DN180_c1_g1_i4:490-1359(-)
MCHRCCPQLLLRQLRIASCQQWYEPFASALRLPSRPSRNARPCALALTCFLLFSQGHQRGDRARHHNELAERQPCEEHAARGVFVRGIHAQLVRQKGKTCATTTSLCRFAQHAPRAHTHTHVVPHSRWQYFDKSKIGDTTIYKISEHGAGNVARYKKWLNDGVFDALAHKYLAVARIEIYKHAARTRGSGTRNVRNASAREVCCSANLLECYAFHVTYGAGHAQLQLSVKRDEQRQRVSVKDGCREMLSRLIQLTQALEPLPSAHVVSVKVRCCATSCAARTLHMDMMR